MRVLITGAQGCIGTWVTRLLLADGYDVLLFDRVADNGRLRLIAGPERASRARLVTGELGDTARLKTLVRDEQITHVIHLAAVLMPFCQANPVEGARINVLGTLNLFEAARDAGRPVRISYASSSAVWGPEELYTQEKVPETESPHPSTHYGVFKHANEQSARVFYDTDGISSVGLRPWTVYGPGRDSGLTAGPTLAMRAAAHGEEFQIRVSGYMDMQYVEDVARAFIASAVIQKAGAHVFNLEGTVVEMNELIRLIDQVRPGSGRRLSAAGPQVPVAFRMDGSRLREFLPGLQVTPLEEGVRRTVEMFESQMGKQT